jgi:Flp pilus assembly protein TadD
MRKILILTGGVLALSAAFFSWWISHRSPPQSSTPSEPASIEPWADSSYQNVRPGVRYVGEQACAECHPSEAESFHRHPMGRSLQPIKAWKAADRLSARAHNPFDSQGLEFRVELRDGRVFHQARRLDAAGNTVLKLEAEVQYVVGSGTRGQSFLVERDGYLFQSSISWYARKGIWDLSPGFSVDQWLERAIGAPCLFCHANRVEAVDGSFNHYRPPTFRGHAIGCERCHGPGELHVQARQSGTAVAGEDRTIVNPERLEPRLREAVCQQCHLEGAARVLRRGRDTFDYVPGLPLGAFWAVYVPPPDISQGQVAVGQVEQMYESKCFRASQGRLGCLSCHDPHDYPAAAERVNYYRGRCLECHSQQGCRLTAAGRQQQNNNDCVACHMPPLHPYDVAHTAMSDHRIRRPPGQQAAESASIPALAAPLLLFPGMDLAPAGREADRELGMALHTLYRKRPELQAKLARDASDRLQRALEIWPDDLPARETCASCLGYQGRIDEMLAQHEQVLARAPDWEASVAGAATAADALGQLDKALALWQRAVALDPWYAAYHDALAQTLAKTKRWPEAIRECDAALELSPARLQTRTLLIGCLAHSGARDRARKEFALLVHFYPQEKATLERWFAKQME